MKASRVFCWFIFPLLRIPRSCQTKSTVSYSDYSSLDHRCRRCHHHPGLHIPHHSTKHSSQLRCLWYSLGSSLSKSRSLTTEQRVFHALICVTVLTSWHPLAKLYIMDLMLPSFRVWCDLWPVLTSSLSSFFSITTKSSRNFFLHNLLQAYEYIIPWSAGWMMEAVLHG